MPRRVSCRKMAKPSAGADHRGDEQQRDGGAEAIAGEEGEEQQDDDRRDQQGCQHCGEDGAADDPAAAVEQPHFADSRSCSSPRLSRMRGSSLRIAVDDPRQPSGADIEESAEPGEQEHRRDGQLDDLRQIAQVRRVRQDRIFGHAGRYALARPGWRAFSPRSPLCRRAWSAS